MAVHRPADTPLHRVQNGDVSLAVERLGHADSQPILFLHGFPEHRGAWRKVAARLCDGFLCLLPDLRGYNDSGRPSDDEAYSVHNLLSDIDALIDDCTRPPVLAGHDWGGVLAWWYAARNPRKIRALITANAPHPALLQKRLCDDADQLEASRYFERLRSRSAPADLLGQGPQSLWDRMFAHNPVFSDRDREEYVAAWDRPGAAEAMLAYYRKAPFVLPPGDVPAPLPRWLGAEEWKIETPSLIAWGMADTVFLPCLLDGLDEFSPDHRIVRFPDAGHAIIHEKPGGLAAAITEFLTP